ncbi:MAG TPA: hypothetical protein VHN79_05675 [Lacunisphaera sp.]|nr:hypothetical protein [Lacunisphaera sp.]
MHWDRELTRLAARKAGLRLRIASRRAQCGAAMEHVTRPVAWLDRALATWRELSPWLELAAPLGLLLKRASTPPRPFRKKQVGGETACGRGR